MGEVTIIYHYCNRFDTQNKNDLQNSLSFHAGQGGYVNEGCPGFLLILTYDKPFTGFLHTAHEVED